MVDEPELQGDGEMVKLKNTSLNIQEAEKIGSIIILHCTESSTLTENPRIYKIACQVKGTT